MGAGRTRAFRTIHNLTRTEAAEEGITSTPKGKARSLFTTSQKTPQRKF